MTQKNLSKGFHKDLTEIVFIPNITWYFLDNDGTKSVFSNGARLLDFRLKILLIKLSVSLAGLIKVFLLRVIKVFYKSPDVFCCTQAYMHGYFIISRPWAKDWFLRICTALSFPFPRFNSNILTINDHLQVTWPIFQQWICHILLRLTS